jgi:hypothetical protein
MPGAAVLATGLLGTAGYLFRRGLLQALGSATEDTMTAMRAMAEVAGRQVKGSGEDVLHRIGLEHRPSFFRSVAGPALGVACGFIAGAVLTHFFAPAVLAQLGLGGTPANDVRDPGSPKQAAASGASRAADGILDHGSQAPASG